MSAPALASSVPVCRFIPPSTSIRADELWRASISRRRVTLLTESLYKWLSAETRIDRHDEYKVDNVNYLFEHCHRGGRIDCHAGKHAGIANLCKGAVEMSARFIMHIHQSAPQSLTSEIYRPGSLTIMWTSRGFSDIFPIAFITGNPMEILGTKLPSITSTCKQNASLELSISSCERRLQKSAASREGATLIFISFEVCEYGLWQFVRGGSRNRCQS